jgi:hypothetical protein
VLRYATVDDLTAQGVSPLPDNVDGYLRRASGLVADATRGAVYAVDAAFLPTDSRVATALMEATVTQVEVWLGAGINPLSGGMDLPEKTVAAMGQGGRTVSYSDLSASVTVQQSRQDAANTLSLSAWLILSRAGLTQGQPVTVL